VGGQRAFLVYAVFQLPLAQNVYIEVAFSGMAYSVTPQCHLAIYDTACFTIV
jgi:hypothetical protein